MFRPGLLRGFLNLCVALGISAGFCALGVLAARALLPELPRWVALVAGILGGLTLGCVFALILERSAGKS